MYNFTPISALTGGILIGCAVVLFFYTTGRLAGISGIFANVFINKSNRNSNLLFLLNCYQNSEILLMSCLQNPLQNQNMFE